ncbi:MAG: hypothetical protein ACO21N_07930, partial [Candidatus Nanopelagicales bacterium]
MRVAIIGNFDGVHGGHRALLHRARLHPLPQQVGVVPGEHSDEHRGPDGVDRREQPRFEPPERAG